MGEPNSTLSRRVAFCIHARCAAYATLPLIYSGKTTRTTTGKLAERKQEMEGDRKVGEREKTFGEKVVQHMCLWSRQTFVRCKGRAAPRDTHPLTPFLPKASLTVTR